MVNIFCALKGEASPLIGFFKLSHASKSELFPVYVNHQRSISLTITGIGKLSAAAAATYTYKLLDIKDNDICLNIGVAGHKNYAIGSLRLANRIEDTDSGECWYPQIMVDTDIQSAGLLSLAKPSTDYCEHMYDMEAAGFYSNVSRFCTAELCHSIKVISDNETRPANKLTKKDISQLITDNLTPISELIDKLSDLAGELVLPDSCRNFEEFVDNWHFTHYQRNKLEQLLRRWQILLPDRIPLDEVSELRQSKDVLTALERQLDLAPISYV